MIDSTFALTSGEEEELINRRKQNFFSADLEAHLISEIIKGLMINIW